MPRALKVNNKTAAIHTEENWLPSNLDITPAINEEELCGHKGCTYLVFNGGVCVTTEQRSRDAASWDVPMEPSREEFVGRTGWW